MGGKRDDQVHIRPNEGRSTDHKTLTDDEHIHAEDKGNLNETRHGHSHIPESAENPALRDLKQRRNDPRAD